MKNNNTHGPIAIALRATVDHRRLLIATMMLSMLHAALIDTLIVIVAHYQSLALLAGIIGISELIFWSVVLCWISGQAQKTA